ncbi:hypothetical protein FPOAC2_10658 [Fusarium poae]|uniref:Amino acid transporter transmembrane domain-containing protein n=1 Tax=Fusarium poae TaxID=36050 RepID=A0A1B8ABM3_FUSPO|nr:hypothetical protein FPOAC1_010381 [Fusarium poae]KAG8665582.1 hypothetical protein FPOAC1_010381 [Fusarium poae]OBS17881.1 hypothetical protein FPOA_09610 [Fusarium poae]
MSSSTKEVIVVEDPVFGSTGQDGPNYRALGWVSTFALMTKTQIGLGVLSIPMSFDILGLIPGMFTLCFIGVITGWSNYMVGVFKQNHPDVYTIDDAGFKMFGRYGREFFAVSFMLNWIFISGSAMLGISIAFNAVSRHAACTAVFVAIAALLTFAFASIRTLGKIGWLAWIGLVCIMTAIFTVTIAVTLEDQPAVARSLGVVDWEPDWKLFGNPSVQQAFSAVGCQVFAFAGTPAFFSIVAEMRDPGLYTRALICSQSVVATVYIIIGCIVYIYCGSYVASPALGSAGPLIKKICYGFALPGLLVTAMIVTHIPAKYVFLRILRGSEHLHRNSLVHWGTWLGCTAGITVTAYIIASAIPIFGSLVSLIGSTFGTLLCFQPYGCMWLYDNWGKNRGKGWMLMVGWSVLVIIVGTAVMIGGTWGTILDIIRESRTSTGSAWSCDDNS